MIDQHTLAWVSIAGVLLDVTDGLYPAYNLFGGEQGNIVYRCAGVIDPT